MKWVTRERPKIDRIACPWLIARFIDSTAEFLFVPSAKVLAIARETGAIPYDIPGVELSHVGKFCSFDAFLKKYELTDHGLLTLAIIVRGADTDRLDLAPQAAGLLAISLGLSRCFSDDHALLQQGMIIYLPFTAVSHAEENALNQARIEQLTGLKGSYDAKEGVFTVRFPRNDLNVNSGGVRITPAFGLTAWAAFTRTGSHVAVMGDMVLLEDQVNPVMSVALDSGLQVTALHNHFSFETPRVMFMHIGGMGVEEEIGRAVGKVFAKIKDTARGKADMPKAQIDPERTTLNPDLIAEILGAKGDLAKGVYKNTVGRATRMDGHEMGKSMGVNSWAAFAGSDDRAVVAGDIALTTNRNDEALISE